MGAVCESGVRGIDYVGCAAGRWLRRIEECRELGFGRFKAAAASVSAGAGAPYR